MAVAVLCLIAYGCATIMHGSSQGIGIRSTPTGAQVSIDNEAFGSTPVVAKLSRKKDHLVRIALEGYEPYETTITKSTSGWVWGNILFGGLIGLGIDAISGGLYKLKPKQIEAELTSQNVGFELEGSEIIITVVLKPDPSWEKVGNLVPKTK